MIEAWLARYRIDGEGNAVPNAAALDQGDAWLARQGMAHGEEPCTALPCWPRVGET